MLGIKNLLPVLVFHGEMLQCLILADGHVHSCIVLRACTVPKGSIVLRMPPLEGHGQRGARPSALGGKRVIRGARVRTT
eukprot:4627032-Amphidinium_carterae.1